MTLHLGFVLFPVRLSESATQPLSPVTGFRPRTSSSPRFRLRAGASSPSACLSKADRVTEPPSGLQTIYQPVFGRIPVGPRLGGSSDLHVLDIYQGYGELPSASRPLTAKLLPINMLESNRTSVLSGST